MIRYIMELREDTKEQSGYRTFANRRSLRLRNFDYRHERVYHIVWGTAGRSLLLRDDLAEAVVAVLHERADKMSMKLLAYWRDAGSRACVADARQ